MNTQDISYLHLRNVTPDGLIDGRGGATIAYRTTEAGTEFAAAFCSPADNFCRAYGRTKAAGRLNSDRFRHTVTETDPVAFRRAMLDGIYSI